MAFCHPRGRTLQWSLILLKFTHLGWLPYTHLLCCRVSLTAVRVGIVKASLVIYLQSYDGVRKITIEEIQWKIFLWNILETAFVEEKCELGKYRWRYVHFSREMTCSPPLLLHQTNSISFMIIEVHQRRIREAVRISSCLAGFWWTEYGFTSMKPSMYEGGKATACTQHIKKLSGYSTCPNDPVFMSGKNRTNGNNSECSSKMSELDCQPYHLELR